MKYSATIQGRTVELDFHRRASDIVEAQIDDRKYVLEARTFQPGLYWLHWDNQSIEVVVTERDGSCLVTMGGRQISVALSEARTNVRHAHEGQSGLVQIRAPMPGKVIRILIDEGQPVDVNQGVVVMEAMKMQNEIKSPKKGVLKKLEVAPGAAVNSGDVLAIVE
jgi:biotin carboxyl carrier protein